MSFWLLILVFSGIYFIFFRRGRVLFVNRGKRGERLVRNRLLDLPEEYTVFNDVLIKFPDGGSSQIDHIVVSHSGVFVVETKNYSGKIYGSENSDEWTEYFNWFSRSRWDYGYRSDSYKFYNPVRQNEGHIKALRAYLKGIGDIPFYSIIAFSNEASLKVTVSSADIVSLKNVGKAIMYRDVENLTDAQVYYIIERLRRLDTDITSEEKAAHVQNTLAAKTKHQLSVQNLICPQCGGRLIRRSGPYGEFWGCSNYPKCKYGRR